MTKMLPNTGPTGNPRISFAKVHVRSSQTMQPCWTCGYQTMHIFLAATKQLYEWFSPSVRPSVRPSHLFDYVSTVFALGLDIVKSWDLKRCVYFESLNFGLSDGAAVTARRRRAQLGGSGGMPPRENLDFCIQFGAFWGFLRG